MTYERVAWLALLATSIAQGPGRFALTPLLPDMRDAAALTAAQAGWLASANFGGYLAGSLLMAGSWKGGRLGPVAIGTLLVAAGAAAMLPLDFASWIVGRAVAGFGGGLLFVAAVASVAQAGGGRNDPRPLAGVGVGIVATGALALALVPSWQLTWGLLAALALAGLAPLRTLHPRGGGGTTHEPAPRLTAPLLRIGASYGLYGFAFSAASTFFVNAFASSGTRGAALAWVVAGAFMAPSVVSWMRTASRIGETRALAAANAVHALGIGVAASSEAFGVAIAAGLLFGISALGVPALSLRCGVMRAPHSARRVSALLTVVFGAGQIAGAPVIGAIATATGSLGTGLALAAGVGALASLTLLPDLPGEGRAH